MHEKYRIFSLYVVQKSPKFFLQWPKKLCHWQKKNTAGTYFNQVVLSACCASKELIENQLRFRFPIVIYFKQLNKNE